MSKRVTTSLDVDVRLMLKDEMARSGEGMKTVINRVLRQILEEEPRATDPGIACIDVSES
jgi:hypothetical protein